MKFCEIGKFKENNKEIICFIIIFLTTFCWNRKNFDCTDAGKVSDCECGTKAKHLGYNRFQQNFSLKSSQQNHPEMHFKANLMGGTAKIFCLLCSQGPPLLILNHSLQNLLAALPIPVTS